MAADTPIDIPEIWKAVEIDASNAQWHCNLGAIYGDQGLFDEAIEEFRVAIKLGGDGAEEHYNLGVALSNKGDVEEAIDELRLHSGKQFDPGLVPLFIEEADRLDSGVAPAVELPPAALLGRDAPIVTSVAAGIRTA